MMRIIGKRPLTFVPSAKTGKMISFWMKTLRGGGMLIIFVQLSSCTTFYFEQPLPVDRSTSNKFPAHLTGTWQSLPDAGVYMINIPYSGVASSGANAASIHWKGNKQKRSALFSADDSLSLLIEGTFFAVIVNRTEKIMRGAWPRLNAAREFVYPPPEVYQFEQLIVYDSLRHPIDTVDQYIFRNAKIYDVDEDGNVSTGRSYLQQQDTLVMKSIDTLFFDLGNNVVLRPLNDRFFAVNIRSNRSGEGSNWWQVYIIEKKASNHFSTWECSRKIKELPSLLYQYRDHTFYFTAAWTAAELLQLMSKGYFVETDEYYLKQ